jgi:hypothetical protein
MCVLKARSFDFRLGEAWERSVAAMLEQMGRKGTKLLVLDLRQNGGGDSGPGTDLLRRVVDRPFALGGKDWRYSRAYQLACLRWGLSQHSIPSWLYLEQVLPLKWFYPGGLDLTGLSGEWIHVAQGWVPPIPGGSWHGKLAVLVDRGTASAAVDVAEYVKDNGLGLVAGEETGGRASFYSTVAPVGLPNSGVYCLIASAYRTRPAGYDDGRGVLPDLPLAADMKDKAVVGALWDRLQHGPWPPPRPVEDKTAAARKVGSPAGR